LVTELGLLDVATIGEIFETYNSPIDRAYYKYQYEQVVGDGNTIVYLFVVSNLILLVFSR